MSSLGASVMLASRLAQMLVGLHPLEATQVACRLALSTSPCHRLTIAAALSFRFHLLGDDVILEHLVTDPEAAVREIATHAAARRGCS